MKVTTLLQSPDHQMLAPLPPPGGPHDRTPSGGKWEPEPRGGPHGGKWLALLIGIMIGMAIMLVWDVARAQGPAPSAQVRSTGQASNTQPTPLLLKRAETRVLDGDTIVQNGVHIRLFGIDAPELGQTCADGWPAGQKAKGFLMVLIEGGLVVCDNRGLDKYGRTLAVCTARGTNLNQAMVRTGNALAYSQFSRAYVLDEITARQSKAGMWAHNCQAPWDYRHGGKSGR